MNVSIDHEYFFTDEARLSLGESPEVAPIQTPDVSGIPFPHKRDLVRMDVDGASRSFVVEIREFIFISKSEMKIQYTLGLLK